MLTRLVRVLKRRRPKPQPGPGAQGEEHEIAEAQRKAREQRERWAHSLVEKAGHANYPYNKDLSD